MSQCLVLRFSGQSFVIMTVGIQPLDVSRTGIGKLACKRQVDSCKYNAICEQNIYNVDQSKSRDQLSTRFIKMKRMKQRGKGQKGCLGVLIKKAFEEFKKEKKPVVVRSERT